MHGFLNIDKPAGLTSHDVVARVRRLSGQRRVGHAGTLDPAATGVLVVALGAATRLIEYVQDQTLKRYTAVVCLGTTTTTDDAEGEILERHPMPAFDIAVIEQALASLRGEIMQTPPMYAALHYAGRRLYELARQGVTVDVPARAAYVERLDLVTYAPPLLTLDVLCGKGTYVRALARDLGAALGCGGHLAALRRTAVGTFRIEDAIPLVALEQDSRTGANQAQHTETTPPPRHTPSPLLHRWLLPPETAVADWDVLDLDDDNARRVRNGLPLAAAADAPPHARAHGPDGILLALLRRDGDFWRPLKVFDWTER